MFPRSQTPVWERVVLETPFRLDSRRNGVSRERVPKQEFGNEGMDRRPHAPREAPFLTRSVRSTIHARKTQAQSALNNSTWGGPWPRARGTLRQVLEALLFPGQPKAPGQVVRQRPRVVQGAGVQPDALRPHLPRPPYR